MAKWIAYLTDGQEKHQIDWEVESDKQTSYQDLLDWIRNHQLDFEIIDIEFVE